MSPTHILVVDDERQILSILDDLLTSYGFTVSTAINAEEALLEAAASPPDIVISDFNIPGGDGMSVCSRIKSRPGGSAIRTVIMTADDEMARSLDGTVDLVISKPFRLVELLEQLARLGKS